MSPSPAFTEIWCADFEFQQLPGERPFPICLVAQELYSGRTLHLWDEELRQRPRPPYPLGPQSLFVAYYASAELSCHLALQWPMPTAVLDLFAEFRVWTNGLPTPCGTGLLGALAYYGLDGMGGAEKASMRHVALRGGPWTVDERDALLSYCAADVAALVQLLEARWSCIDWPRALLRGRYMHAVARMEATGVPIATEVLQSLREHWALLQERLITQADRAYGVFEGRTFKAQRWAAWLAARGLPWPQLPSGALALDDETFRDMARIYPAIHPLRELRATIAQLRLEQLTVGTDGRNRTLLSAFRAKTGRNQPSNSRFIFGPAVWVRSLIRPEPGYGMAYVDWSQQEFGIAAALSGDPAMRAAYTSGDPYLTFAKQAGALPDSGTAATHRHIREQFKACALAVQYGMGATSLALRIGQTPSEARRLLALHRQAYPRFWQWSDSAVDHAMLYGRLHTVFGWTIQVSPTPRLEHLAGNPRSLRNFPMQANGAEMLRFACWLATERGVRVCAPVHDAVLIEAPLNELASAVATTQEAMAEASRLVLGEMTLRSDAKLFRYPEHYVDPRGEAMWHTVQQVLRDVQAPQRCPWPSRSTMVAQG